MFVFVIRVFWIRLRMDDNKEYPEFFGKYDIFFRDFNDDKKSSFFYPLFIIRRLVIILTSQIAMNKMIQLSVLISFHSIVRLI